MGEKIKDLETIKIGNTEFTVELNKGTGNHGRYDFHIQNSKCRLNVSEKDFYKMACGILAAESQLLSYKNFDNNKG